VINLLYLRREGKQYEVEYTYCRFFIHGRGSVHGGGGTPSRALIHFGVNGVEVAAGGTNNPYAAFHCSNCGMPMQSVRSLGICGLRRAREQVEYFPELYLPNPSIRALHDGVCWHGRGNCADALQ